MTESFFRGVYFRILEYGVYRALNGLHHPRSKRVSLGIAQVQARYWIDKPRLNSILSARSAYDVLTVYLEMRGASHKCLQKKVALHVGEARSYYLRLALMFTHVTAKWVSTYERRHSSKGGDGLNLSIVSAEADLADNNR